MSQVTIYLPEQVANELRTKARRAQKSVSAYVVELIEKRDRPNQWPKNLGRLYGSCRGTLPKINDLSPDEGPEL
jgi:macrodomain Ter protein organizer (MatP/YcbG family)